eukprot:15454639-Alexandrium_andersonii.AAC.1
MSAEDVDCRALTKRSIGPDNFSPPRTLFLVLRPWLTAEQSRAAKDVEMLLATSSKAIFRPSLM